MLERPRTLFIAQSRAEQDDSVNKFKCQARKYLGKVRQWGAYLKAEYPLDAQCLDTYGWNEINSWLALEHPEVHAEFDKDKDIVIFRKEASAKPLELLK